MKLFNIDRRELKIDIDEKEKRKQMRKKREKRLERDRKICVFEREKGRKSDIKSQRETNLIKYIVLLKMAIFKEYV